ncbi:SURF1 family cytochrome oxidase biogenesis protein [Microbacterium sp. No. 7]|uniref:SURF1 family cytochrome oxidase biogenesis protein n=1 Tax=Microbacterium sp. No. 7 TaxID=1714373 RepID=UPI0006ECE824|nr:SURF1 family cytochrome oxidase biogenesis protein [Microbacterium sp. No. 7]ALJ19129.1 hypothetical protein AOA12_04110 [Microbacterium sp. No. 7]
MSAPSPVSEAPAPPVFPPTLREVMLRPWWIGMLGLALVVAGVFAWLGQWQLSRSIDFNPPPVGATEQVRPIADVVEPGAYLPEPLVGQRVDVSGRWVAGDFLLVSSRFNEGVEGYWITGQLRVQPDVATLVAEPTSLAVAIAWTPTLEQALAAAARFEDAVAADPEALATLTGRLVSDEGPAHPPAADPWAMSRMSPAALLSRWHDIEGLSVYRPFLVADADTTGLDLPAGVVGIHSPAPTEQSPVNVLNLFYAIEWAVFAGFAFYMWYRLAKDAWQKEVEELEEAEEG